MADSMDEFDYVIIGAGSAGCVLADRISEDGRNSVLVLEYGGSDRSIYIQMPTTTKSSEAPALLVAAGDGSEMVNYRVRGDYYVVDKLFDQAVLVSGVGREQDRVSIRYTGAAR